MARFLKTGSVTTIKDSITGSINLPVGDDTDRSPTPFAGEVRFNSDSNNFEFYDGTEYQNVAVKGNVSIIKDSFIGDGSTTVFNLSVTPDNENSILVFVGNVFQNPGVAYTLSGSSITFSSAPPNTHTVIVLHGFNSTSV